MPPVSPACLRASCPWTCRNVVFSQWLVHVFGNNSDQELHLSSSLLPFPYCHFLSDQWAIHTDFDWLTKLPMGWWLTFDLARITTKTRAVWFGPAEQTGVTLLFSRAFLFAHLVCVFLQLPDRDATTSPPETEPLCNYSYPSPKNNQNLQTLSLAAALRNRRVCCPYFHGCVHFQRGWTARSRVWPFIACDCSTCAVKLWVRSMPSQGAFHHTQYKALCSTSILLSTVNVRPALIFNTYFCISKDERRETGLLNKTHTHTHTFSCHGTNL